MWSRTSIQKCEIYSKAFARKDALKTHHICVHKVIYPIAKNVELGLTLGYFFFVLFVKLF